MVFTQIPFLLLLLLFQQPVALQLRIQIPSGRTIPASVLTDRLPHLRVESARKRFYEITADFRIIGHNLNLSIHQVTNEAEEVAYRPRIVLADGKEKTESTHVSVHIRKGPSFRVGHTTDGIVLGVWGPGVSLEPVDLKNYPGIYINSLSNSMQHANDSGGNIINPQSPEFPSQLRTWANTSTRTGATCEKRGRSLMVELAVAFSSRLCSRYGSFKATQQALLTLVKIASEPFEYQTCLFLKITTFDGYCSPHNDPYRDYKNKFSSTGDDAEEMLTEFANFWFAKRKYVKRDLAYFIPAFGNDEHIGGVAYLGGVCNKYLGYGWADRSHPILFAHEIGHSFNAKHSKAGIMAGQLSFFNLPDVFMTYSAKAIADYALTKKCLGLKKYSAPNLETCGFKFPAQLGFACKRAILPSSSWNVGASVQKTVILSGGEIRLKLFMKLSKQIQLFRFKKVLTYVSANDSISGLGELMKYASVETIRNNNPTIYKASSAAGLKAHPDWSNCCGKKISIYIHLEVENIGTQKKWSGRALNRYKWTLPCTSCRSRLRPMNRGRRCPICD